MRKWKGVAWCGSYIWKVLLSILFKYVCIQKKKKKRNYFELVLESFIAREWLEVTTQTTQHISSKN